MTMMMMGIMIMIGPGVDSGDDGEDSVGWDDGDAGDVGVDGGR